MHTSTTTYVNHHTNALLTQHGLTFNGTTVYCYIWSITKLRSLIVQSSLDLPTLNPWEYHWELQHFHEFQHVLHSFSVSIDKCMIFLNPSIVGVDQIAILTDVVVAGLHLLDSFVHVAIQICKL